MKNHLKGCRCVFFLLKSPSVEGRIFSDVAQIFAPLEFVSKKLPLFIQTFFDRLHCELIYSYPHTPYSLKH